MTESELEGINLLDYLSVIVKRRRMIFGCTFVASVFMAVISLFLTEYYKATTTLLPPDDKNQQGLVGMLADAPMPLLDVAGLSGGSSKIFQEILTSRTVAEGVLSRTYQIGKKSVRLCDHLNAGLKSSGYARLHSLTTISATEPGIITISVEMDDPDLAAQVAMAFVEELDAVNQAKSLSRAKSSRLYIEEQLEQTGKNLKKASIALADFQSEFKAVNLEQQTKVAIEKAGEVKGTIMAREVELAVARQTMKADNPVIIRLEKELAELRKHFEHIQFGNSVPFKEQRDYFIPFSDVPEVGLQFADLFREVKVQETVWQLLNKQYYSAKIQEARDTPTVQVLDEAFPPERRSRPRRTALVLLTAFVTFGLSVLAAFVWEFAQQVRCNEVNAGKVRVMITELKNDLQAPKALLEKIRARLPRS